MSISTQRNKGTSTYIFLMNTYLHAKNHHDSPITSGDTADKKPNKMSVLLIGLNEGPDLSFDVFFNITTP